MPHSLDNPLMLEDIAVSIPDSPSSAPPNDCESEPLFDHTKTSHHISFGATGEKKDTETSRHRPRTHNSSRRTRYYEDRFSYKPGTGSVREGVFRDSPIIAELRTNVIMKDEYPLIMDLSQILARRYQRLNSSVMVSLEHSACLLLGGTFDPTYIFTITALSVHVQPTINKRNAALLQSFLSDALGVPPHRGIVKFQSTPEENIAINGTTVLGEVERMEKQFADDNASVLKRTMTKASRKSLVLKSKPSLLTMGSSPTAVGPSPYGPVLLPMPVEIGDVDGLTSLLSDPTEFEVSSVERKPSDSPSRRKGVSSKLEEASSKRYSFKRRTMEAILAEANIPLPNVPLPSPIPTGVTTSEVGKMKSFIAMFKW